MMWMKQGARSRRSPPRVCALGAVAAALASGCSQQSTATQLRALQTSGEISFLCLSHGPDGVATEGQARELCPDFEHDTASEPAYRRMHALVTQPESGEVALVDLFTADPVDSEPTQPGFNFLAVGAEPVSLVSTPGGQASFVSVREPGREGIFALPTSCIGARPPGAPLRDITIWPACRLPAAPGPMAVLIDPGQDDDGDAITPPAIRERCGADYLPAAELVGSAPGATRELCPADLGLEGKPYGRRKLAVALPSYHEIWLLDAQELLDRAPGSFEACSPEQRVLLRAEVSAAPQPLPPDLVPPSASCSPSALSHGPLPEPFTPWPSDFAVDDEQRLYVADTQAPVVHVLDAQNPCALTEVEPLLPSSYLDPGALITTRRVAVSPLTPLGKRFVYAVDDSTSDTAGSLIAFDVSPGSSARAPLLRERSPWSPLEPPDRIVFAQDVSDVEFVFRDQPAIDPTTRVGIEGIECDPHPLSSDSIAARYRPSAALDSGAAPQTLRGTFAIAALHSGRLAVVDVEDLNAACRRPIEANFGADEDIRGCSNDDPTVPVFSGPFLEENGLARTWSSGGYLVPPNGPATVTRELSCNVVAPHRVRSQSFFGNATGARSAALRAFPTLSLETGRAVATDQSDEGRTEPRMLMARAVPPPPPGAPQGPEQEHAELVVGTFAYTTNDPSRGRLEPDPNLAERSSLLLTYQEPRAYIPGESFTATYEGAIGFQGQGYLTADSARGLLSIDQGVNGKFCQGGVQDLDLTRAVGVELGVPAGSALDGFARGHADYVQILDDLLPEDDAHWREGGAGAACGVELFESDGAGLSGRSLCDNFFGPSQVENTTRDLRIVEASEGSLLTEPRIAEPNMSAQRRRLLSEFVACCFPRPARFAVRAGQQWVISGSASGVQHHVKADPANGRCVNDCNPLTQRLRGRAFEVSCTGACERPAGEDRPVVGLATPEDVACVVDSVADGIDPGEPGAQCVYQSLTTRFAIYRGRAASKRNMRFRWQLSGGFQPFLFNLTSLDRESSPRSLLYSGELDRLFVSDGSTRGLTYIPLRSPSLQTIF